MGALEGMRVFDVTQYEAGTSCTQALAWLGADVVKVEPPTGDPGRGGPRENGGYFVFWNSNKRGIAIDLRKPKGLELLLDMVPNYDVFVENYSPGSMERLGLGYDVLKEINPGIIYTRIKGFGLDGPWSNYKCFDMVAQAAAGAFSITGFPDGPPMRPGPTMGDAGTGVQTALAIAAAYVQKLNTGKGQLIEMSMQESMTYYLRTAVSRGNYGETALLRTGNGRSPTSRLYKCKGDGPNDYLFLMGTTQPMWERLCAVMDRPDLLEDPRFATRADREANDPALTKEIAAWLAEREKYAAMHELCEADIPASAVLDTKDLYENPHLLERGFVHEIDHPALGRIKILGWAPRMSESDVPIKPAPTLGQHSREVVAEDLSLSGDDIDTLVAEGVIYS